jgi:hypothetical protein
MNVHVEAEKSKTLKVKLQPDELNVRVGKNVSHERTASSATLLKAQFEEAVNALRNERPFSIKCTSTVPAAPLVPACPSLEAQHPLLQSLLKLVWETHTARFHAVVRVFDAGIQMKLQNTQRLVDLRVRMKTSAEELLEQLHASSTEHVRKEFRSTWLDTLRDAQRALGTGDLGIDELMAEALRRLQDHGANPWVMKTETLLGTLRKDFQQRSQSLWDEWTLHMKRHRFVFEGKMGDVERVDKQLQEVGTRSRVYSEEEPRAEETGGHQNEHVQAWQQLVVLLHTIKLDFDIQLSSVARLRAATSQSLDESRATVFAESFSTIVQQEDLQLTDAKNQLTQELETISVSRDRIIRELSLACNNSLTHVDATLKAMQLSCDLAMESARECAYVRALQTLKTMCK